jgi:hypothetical protein
VRERDLRIEHSIPHPTPAILQAARRATGTALYYSVLLCTALYCSVLDSTLLHSTLLYIFRYFLIHPSTHPSSHHMITSHTTGSVAYAIDRVLGGKNRNAFCVVRPPGHHAGTFVRPHYLHSLQFAYLPSFHSYFLPSLHRFLSFSCSPSLSPYTTFLFSHLYLHHYLHHQQFTY